MDWALKASFGAIIVILIQIFSQTRNYYIAGLIPLFPTFALIAHYLIGSQRLAPELKETIVFGMFSLVPYFLYLSSLYFLIDRYRLITSLAGATAVWVFTASILFYVWNIGR